MKYRVKVSKRVEKFLAGLRDLKLRQRFITEMRGMEAEPRPPGCKKLSGATDIFRLRVGDYRIIYQIEDDRLVVLVIDIGHRREIYR